MAKQSYKDKNGTSRIGDALRWLVANGKKVAPELLGLAGNITGIEPLKILADKINIDKNISQIDKDFLIKETEFDMIEMQEVTKRWESDNAADSFMTKNIRPLVLAFLTLTLFITFTCFSTTTTSTRTRTTRTKWRLRTSWIISSRTMRQ